MRKTTLMLAVATVLSVATINCNAQYLFLAKLGGGIVAKHLLEDEFLHSSTKKTTAEKEVAKANKASSKLLVAKSKAAFDFNKQFKNQENAEWYVGEYVITATFKDNDASTHCIYDKKGHWIHNITTYQENRMPADVKELIQNEFRGYDITLVQEIEEGGKTFYVVHLLKGKNYKEVGVYDGEANIIKELTLS